MNLAVQTDPPYYAIKEAVNQIQIYLVFSQSQTERKQKSKTKIYKYYLKYSMKKFLKLAVLIKAMCTLDYKKCFGSHKCICINAVTCYD